MRQKSFKLKVAVLILLLSIPLIADAKMEQTVISTPNGFGTVTYEIQPNGELYIDNIQDAQGCNTNHWYGGCIYGSNGAIRHGDTYYDYRYNSDYNYGNGGAYAY